jgi:hypothetical protein
MNAFAIRTILAASIGTLIVTPAFADSIKAANTTALNDIGSWTNATVPGVADIAIWNSTVTAPNASQLGGDLSWLGLQIGNVGGTRNTTTNFLTIANTSSANTLTLGASGIEMSNAFQTLVIQSRLNLIANQTWNIANANTNVNPAGLNNGEDLAFRAQAAATPMNFGGNTVTTSGAGSITVTGGYTMSNGTLDVAVPLFVIQGGDNRVTTIDSTLTLNVNSGGALRLQSNSGAMTSNAPINLNGGNLIVHVNNATNAVTMNGSLNVLAASTITVSSPVSGPAILNGNLSGSAALALNNTTADVARVLQFAGNNSGYSGTITLGGTAGRATRLTSANAGSAAATWSVSTGHILQVNGVAVDLGTLNGAGTVTNSLAAVPAVISVGAGSFSGAITNGSTGGAHESRHRHAHTHRREHLHGRDDRQRRHAARGARRALRHGSFRGGRRDLRGASRRVRHGQPECYRRRRRHGARAPAGRGRADHDAIGRGGNSHGRLRGDRYECAGQSDRCAAHRDVVHTGSRDGAENPRPEPERGNLSGDRVHRRDRRWRIRRIIARTSVPRQRRPGQ